MGKIFRAMARWGRGYPLLILALVIGFTGAVISGVIPNMSVMDPETQRLAPLAANQWWFIGGFVIDLVLVLIFIVYNGERGEASPLFGDNGQANDHTPGQP